MLVEVHYERLAQAALARLDASGRGAKQACMKATGINNGSFFRFLEGKSDNINICLSICKYFGWDIMQFTQTSTDRKKDWIIV